VGRGAVSQIRISFSKQVFFGGCMSTRLPIPDMRKGRARGREREIFRYRVTERERGKETVW
jgi:hypothetical protein